MTPSKIVDSYWFTTYSGKSFGIVKVQTTNGIRFYIGNAQGKDQKVDERSIHKYGSPLDSVQVTKYLTTDEILEKPKYNTRHHNELLGALMVGIGLGIAVACYFI